MADERCGVVGHVVAGEVGLILGEPGEEQGDVAFVDADIVPSFLRFPTGMRSMSASVTRTPFR